MTYDGELVIIPNTEVFENPIVNYTHTPMRRQSITIGLGYEEDVDRAKTAFMAAIKSVDGVQKEPEPTIYVDNMGDSTLVMKAYFWTNQKERNIFEVQSQVITAIKVVSEQNGINLPYPIQTVRLEKVGKNLEAD
jgi:small-conductance mechanosensitive channel